MDGAQKNRSAPGERTTRRTASPGALLFSSIVLFLIGGLILYEGGRLIWLGRSGSSAKVKVSDCDVTGSGRSRKVNCTGAWTVGGSLLDGGHVVVGSIIGADTDDEGKTLDVTIIGEAAYTASFLHIALPIIIGLGCLSLVGAVLLIRMRSQR
jgi:hypothetical protein